VLVLVVGLAATAVLAYAAREVHDNNENHLLRERVNEAAAVLSVAATSVQAPLSSAAILAEGTNANMTDFTGLMQPWASGASGAPFVSASIWPAQSSSPRPLFVIGAEPELAALPAADIRAFLAQTTAKPTVAILDLLGKEPRRLGYGVSIGPKARYIVYAESARPANRRTSVDSNAAFSDVDYTISLGDAPGAGTLLASSTGKEHLSGRTAAADVAFGNSKLHLVLTPRRELGGDLPARLPWLIALFGTAIALAAGLLTERLVRRREDAERLAGLNARLFSEQRSVAQTLQHSLLPEVLPQFPGLEVAVRYVPGVEGVDVGGDWYDVIDVGEGRVLLVVGDVSGRGLRAATVMASLRYAIRAFASQGDDPEEILRKLSRMIDVGRDAHFATVICGLVSVAERRITFANAGHPNPLLISGSSSEFVATNVGAPIGVATDAADASTVTVPPGGVVVAYTDGLFERRGESPDVSLARLQGAAIGYDSLDDMLDGLLRVLTPAGGNDDTAILAVTWRP
jgi:serine phosphatase RsbU (regulator of sigma subunit)/type II secretory pathway pseudopilin PulG